MQPRSKRNQEKEEGEEEENVKEASSRSMNKIENIKESSTRFLEEHFSTSARERRRWIQKQEKKKQRNHIEGEKIRFRKQPANFLTAPNFARRD